MRNLFSGIYAGKNVLVTGHTGFKGSWLAYWLSEMGANVTGYALAPNTVPCHIDLLKISMRSVIGNVDDLESVQMVFAECKPEIVFHLAAQPLVRYSYQNPVETFRSNVVGTLNICEAARLCPSVRAIVAITTDKVYQNKEWEWGYRENDRLGGHDPYSGSKACAEVLLETYRLSYFNPEKFGKEHSTLLASVRAGNVIGGGDWSLDRLIPDIVKAAANRKSVTIRNPQATRPWQHVLECLSGYLLVGKRLLEQDLSCATAFNFGPGQDDTLPVYEISKLAQNHWAAIQCDFPNLGAQPHEAGKLHLDCAKARTMLEWRPVWHVPTAIEQTIQWYRNYYEQGVVSTSSDLTGYVNQAVKGGAVWA